MGAEVVMSLRGYAAAVEQLETMIAHLPTLEEAVNHDHVHDRAFWETAEITAIGCTGDMYYVEPDIGALIAAGAATWPMESGLAREMVPGDCRGCLWFAEPYALTTVTGEKRAVRLMSWTRWKEAPPSLHDMPFERVSDAPGEEATGIAVSYGYAEGPNLAFEYFTWHYSDCLTEKHICHGLITYLIAFFAFIQQQVLNAVPTHLDRAVLRRLRRRDPAYEPHLHVVQLRKRYAPQHEGGSEPKEWGCQWMVRGHWRQHWHPSLGEHRPLWVHPYVKGPEDKPFREPKRRVFAVVR